MRALLCWVFSLFFLKFDENGNYDIRFKLRGDQKVSQQIVLINVSTTDFSKMYDVNTRPLIKAAEINNLTDSFYWDKELWKRLLSKILRGEPKKVGVSFYFGNNIGQVKFSDEENSVFRDPRVIWAANSRDLESFSLPIAASGDQSNVGNTEILKDDDGIVRRIQVKGDSIPNFAERLADRAKPDENVQLAVINFKGKDVFKEIPLDGVLSDKFPLSYLKDKIVIIGAEKSPNSQVQTPIGLVPRHKFWATVTENLTSDSFIYKLSSVIYAGFLLGLTILAILTITNYPQSIALFFLVWLGTLTSAFSAWIFDSFYVWIPIVSPLSLLIFVWVLFIGYQALKIEQAHTRLQQQQNYLAELEQLKNNFVSLISHDLKTPIAKIQGVLDRLLIQSQKYPDLQGDLLSLKDYSEELNRYIQSILKVLRVESRDFKIVKETADINGIIENVTARLSPLARSKNISINCELDPMFLIEIDVTLMTEVFLNIIENAIKYTPPGGKVTIKSFETDRDVCVEISDSGEGITIEDQEIIWKKFTRGKTQDYKTKGSGLGLYLVKYFIELHGGDITLKSEVNKGTTFTVKLPIEYAEAEANA